MCWVTSWAPTRMEPSAALGLMWAARSLMVPLVSGFLASFPASLPSLFWEECFLDQPRLRTPQFVSGSRETMWPSAMLVTTQKPGSGSHLCCRKSGWWGPCPWKRESSAVSGSLLPAPGSHRERPSPKDQWWEAASLTLAHYLCPLTTQTLGFRSFSLTQAPEIWDPFRPCSFSLILLVLILSLHPLCLYLSAATFLEPGPWMESESWGLILLKTYDLAWPPLTGIDSQDHQEAGPGLFTVTWF